MVQTLLVQRAEYELCRKYVGDGQESFFACRDAFDTTRTMLALQSRRGQRVTQHLADMNRLLGWPPPPVFPDAADRLLRTRNEGFVQQTCELIEILVGTGHKDEAEKIHGQALVLLADTRLQSAIADAEKKTGR
jgi:hypothetical protein